MKKDLRGKFWKDIPKEERTRIMSKVATLRWKNKTTEEKSEWGKRLNEVRWGRE